MAIFRTVALAAPVAALMLPGLPAHACDSNYPWLCKPVPSIDSSEAETKPAKPLPITSQRKDASAAKAKAAAKPAKAKVQRSAQARVKQVARKPPARRLVLRPRHQNVAAAPLEDPIVTPSESMKIAPPRERVQKPAVSSAGVADATNEPNTGFAAAWERTTGVAEPIGAAPVAPAAPAASAAAAAAASEPASEPAPVKPVPVVSQGEVNEIDLAAADSAPQSDGSWLRGLFIAFGGILALGSALRLFL
jgi:hypothetical protein